MVNNAYIAVGEAVAALVGACAIGWLVKWGSSMLLTVLVGHHLADDPSRWDLLRLISLYSGLVGGALFLLWRIGRRRRAR